jgi:hypothetical protein
LLLDGTCRRPRGQGSLPARRSLFLAFPWEKGTKPRGCGQLATGGNPAGEGVRFASEWVVPLWKKGTKGDFSRGGLSGLFWKYVNELFPHRKDAEVAEKMVFCSGGERPPEQKPPPFRSEGFVQTSAGGREAVLYPAAVSEVIRDLGPVHRVELSESLVEAERDSFVCFVNPGHCGPAP